MRLLIAAAVAVGLLQSSAGDLVELDVLVLDHDNRPVRDLRQSEFSIREDGRPAEIKTFTPAGPSDDGRQLVILLDDASVPMNGTPIIQAMAHAVLLRKKPEDEVTVVRLSNDRDEPFGDDETALARIADYHAGASPFNNRATPERSLRVVASIARSLEGEQHRRKALVCIGGPRVCNVLEPYPRGYSDLWKPWVAAIAAAGRANLAVYAVMPVMPGTPVMLSGGLADVTGGDGFSNATNFERFVSDIWVHANSYYLLGYWPGPAKRDVHSIEVKVARKGLKVRTRRYRA